MENFDKLPRKKVSKLGIAGAALLGTLAAQPADAGHLKSQDTKSHTINLKSEIKSPLDRVNWFTKGMNALHTLLPHEVVEYEDAVEKGEVPLSLQIAFLEKTLGAGSVHYKQLQDPNLPAERLSKIIKMVDAVSTRMTLAYAADDASPEVRKYFDIRKMAEASRHIDLLVPATKNAPVTGRFCNGFFTREGQDVYFAIAKHCVVGTTHERQYTFADNDADTAVMYVPPQDYARVSIENTLDLPEIDKTTTLDNASGHVIVSYSHAPKNKQGAYEEKVHFSFAMPFSPNVRALTFGQDIDQKGPYMKSTMMFLKPHGEGEVVETRPDGSVSTRASGSSGSIVGEYENGEYHTLGNFMGTSTINDTCTNLCYSISFNATPEALKDAIKIERAKRQPQG